MSTQFFLLILFVLKQSGHISFHVWDQMSHFHIWWTEVGESNKKLDRIE